MTITHCFVSEHEAKFLLLEQQLMPSGVLMAFERVKCKMHIDATQHSTTRP